VSDAAPPPRRRVLLRVALILGALFLFVEAPLLYFGGGAAIRKYDAFSATQEASLARIDAEIAAFEAGLRARIAASRRPVFRGEPVDEDAYPRLVALLARIVDADSRSSEEAILGMLRDDLAAGPCAPLPARAHRMLSHLDELPARLEAAARCARLEPTAPRPITSAADLKEKSLYASINWLHVAAAGIARARLEQGDVDGAIGILLDAMRVALDVSELPPVMVAQTGVERAVREIARIATCTADAASLPLDAIERAMDLLEPALPTRGALIRREVEEDRATYRSFQIAVAETATALLATPERALNAYLLEVKARLHERLAEAAAERDPVLRRARLEEEAALMGGEEHAIHTISLPHFWSLDRLDEVHERIAGLRRAVAARRADSARRREPVATPEGAR